MQERAHIFQRCRPNEACFARFHGSRRLKRAFTVIELLVAVSIMSVIIFGLYQMFNKTQRALRGNITQTDVMESGRAALEMISRELEQLSACELAGGTNFYASLIPVYRPLIQLDLDEKSVLRTNVLQEFFFLSRSNNVWSGTGYRVIGANAGVGTLYRFSVSTNQRYLNPTNLSADFVTAPLSNAVTRTVSTNYHRVADGIVHLRLNAVDPAGRKVSSEGTNIHPTYVVNWFGVPGRTPLAAGILPNVVVRRELYGQTGLIFLSNALPAYVEVELGVIEAEALSRYNSLRLGSATAAETFLRKQANKVHLFRRRIPIRTATQ